MKRTILLTAAILCAAGTRAQEAYDLLIPEPETPVALRPVEGGRIYRTEVSPYDRASAGIGEGTSLKPARSTSET